MHNQRKGVASLATTLILGGVILEIAVAGAVLVMILTSGSYGERLTAQAFDAAKSGLDDALLSIVRTQSFTDATYNYGSNADAVVTFETNVCGAGCDQITSIGRALTKRRKILANVEIDNAGMVKVLSVTVEPL